MLLSICIPTHEGRCESLAQALESVIAEVDRSKIDLEVCISGNGSQDGTVEVVESARMHLRSRLVYERHESDIGFTRNLLSVVELASGRYCWLFSSDDTVAEGALDELGVFLARHDDPSGLALRPGALGHDLAPGAEVLPLLAFPREPGAIHLYDSAASASTQCGFLTGLLPAQIVRRDLWNSIVAGPRTDLRVDALN